MRNPALFSRIFNTPLLIQPTKLDAIIAGIGGRFGIALPAPDMSLTAEGEYARPGYQVIGNVAVIDIFGVLQHRGKLEAASTYIQGYDDLGKQINAALANPDVYSILLQIDSPGGEAAGAFELASLIKQARNTKPINAVISSQASSAGYLLASAAGDIAISETGQAGSIGVVMRHADMSKMAEKEGLSITYIYAGGHKIDGNPFQPLPPDVKASFQTEIDKLYGLFVQTVSVNRNLTSDEIRAQQAAIFTGQDAINAGLANRISTPDEMLAEMQSLPTTTQRGIFMSAPNAERTALEQQAQEQARAEGFTAGKTEGITEGQTLGATAERARIAAILNHPEAQGRAAQATVMALETDMTAEQAGKLLAASPKVEPTKVAGNPFAAHMAKLKNPDIGPGEGDGDGEGGESEAALIANVVALHHKTRGVK